jgi:hypothetical protein
MENILEELAEAMEADIAVQERILEKMKEQQDLLVECALDKLELNLKDLDDLRGEAAKKDRARTAQKQRLARLLKIEESTPTLARLLAEVEGPLYERLVGLSARFMDLLKTIRLQSRRNMVLIRQSMELNRTLMKQITGQQKERPSTYGQMGELIAANGPGVIDAKA